VPLSQIVEPLPSFSPAAQRERSKSVPHVTSEQQVFSSHPAVRQTVVVFFGFKPPKQPLKDSPHNLGTQQGVALHLSSEQTLSGSICCPAGHASL
jgi:hypothetical protein